MRTLLALVPGLLLVACTVGDSGPGGDDDDGGAVCGNGAVEPGEQCDGSADCTATCTTKVPKLEVRVDKPAITGAELRSTHMVTVTLIASGGFGGSVPLTAKVVDANNVEVPGWAVALPGPTAAVPVDGSVDVVATLTIPSDAQSLNGTIKVEAAPSGLAAVATRTDVTATKVVTLNVTMNGNGQCVYTAVAGTTRIPVGTQVRMKNKGTATMIFHSDGAGAGIPHQDVATTIPIDGSYDRTITTVTGAFNWYCHSPGPNPGAAVQILPVAAP
jgi:hypothetical protein